MIADEARRGLGREQSAALPDDQAGPVIRPPFTEDEVNRLAFVRWRKANGQMQVPACTPETERLCAGLIGAQQPPSDPAPRRTAQPIGRWPLAHRP
jgi:hypothetical protein